MKRIISLLLIFTMVISMFSGCKPEEKKNVSLSIKTSFVEDDTSGPAFNKMFKEFTDKYPDIVLNHSAAKAEDTWKEIIRTEFESGEEADITFFFTAVDSEPIIKSGKVVSIDEIREVYPDYAKNIKEDVLNMLKAEDGKTYAVPVKGFWEGLICNRELFKKYNVPPITDYASLLTAIKIFNENGITPIAASFSDVPNYWIESMIMTYGGSKIHGVNPKTNAEIPKEWIDGLNGLKKLYDLNAFSKDSLVSSNDLAIASFNNSKAAMILEGSWTKFDTAISDNVDIVPVPTSEGNNNETAIIAGATMGFYISRKAWENPDKREACVKVVEYFTSKDSIEKFCANGEAPPAEIEVSLPDSKFVSEAVNYAAKNKQQLPIDSRLSKPSWEYLRTSIPSILKGKSTPEDVLKKVVEYNKE